jgi:hypothetical protein
MALKKHIFKEGEIAIYDDALISKRGDYWQMRMWLQQEGKYARFSLRTRNESTAIDKAKQHYESARVPWRPVGLSQALMMACSARCR